MTPRDLLAIGVMALGVYLPKLLPVLLLGSSFSAPVRRWLGYVAPAVLGALVAPAILAPDRQLAPPGLDALAYLAAFLVSVATRRMLPAVAAGLAVVFAMALVAG